MDPLRTIISPRFLFTDVIFRNKMSQATDFIGKKTKGHSIYEDGVKYCSDCRRYLITLVVYCEICKTRLRTNPKNHKYRTARDDVKRI